LKETAPSYGSVAKIILKQEKPAGEFLYAAIWKRLPTKGEL
jgi:hypothetical protein